jgi:hypothetical protein
MPNVVGNVWIARLMVPRFARQRAIAVSVQPDVREHPNSSVRVPEACLGADCQNLRVGNVTRGTVE